MTDLALRPPQVDATLPAATPSAATPPAARRDVIRPAARRDVIRPAAGFGAAPPDGIVPGIGSGSATLAWTGLIVSVFAMIGLAVGGPTQAPAAVAFAALGPGAALFSHLSVGPASFRWASAMLVSLAGYAAAATVSVWAGWWQPRALVGALAVGVAVSCLSALLRGRRRARTDAALQGRTDAALQARTDAALQARTVRRTRAGTAGRPAAAVRTLLAHAAMIGTALTLWQIAVRRTEVTEVGGFGLLATIHPVYLLAVAVTVTGFVIAVAGLPAHADQPPVPADGPLARSRGLAAAGYLVLLIALLHGTTPLLLDQPQYAWTYKHLGVIEYIAAGNPVGAAQDIYQQWPALFAGAAQLGAAGAAGPATLADWSPLVFNLAAALVLYAIARTLSGDRRVAYLTVFGFLAVNWVEEDYLSPQAFGFLLSLGIMLFVLARLRTPVAAGSAERPSGTGAVAGTSGRRARVGATVAALALLAVLTAAHQLSPYLVVAQVAVLAALRLIRPRWLPLAMAVIVLGYLLPRFGFVSEAFGVFDGFDVFANAAGNADGWGSTGQAYSAIVVRTLALTVWALTVLAVLAHRRRWRTVVVPALLAATPFVLIAGQSYGGEAIYRVFLFSAPWCAYLIATAVVDQSDRRRAGRRGWLGPVAAVTLAVALAVFVLGTVQGRHGQLVVDRQTSDEVAAARALYATAEPGATIAVATSNFPSRLTSAYPGFNTDVPAGEPDLVVGAGLRGESLDGEHLPAIEEFLRSFAGEPAYLVISDGMRRQADYFGYFPAGSLDRLEQLLADRDGWSVFQRGEDVTVYRYAGA
ncbi:hypothetical protein O7632_25485 [Solwaraspora sp. WMMD406]|uniref:hypothetical protein n=1 Tax=Solwaraspora sp. WMMD406 TaxID=3016095 RepID=UPI00241761AC|nr:hypothetical protein [Solwaraspora sp. WMMD406]MDG4767417.1 hypothetical protein [Solwaraspora sp. WMMD406]